MPTTFQQHCDEIDAEITAIEATEEVLSDIVHLHHNPGELPSIMIRVVKTDQILHVFACK